MALKDWSVVLSLLSLAVKGGVTMTSRPLPFQVTFGEDGRPQMEDVKNLTACGYAHTALYGTSQSPCATLETWSNTEYTIPVDGRTISFPVRLDFTLKNPDSNVIEVRFIGGGSKIYIIEFRSKCNKIVIEDSSVPLDLEFDESHRFWVTYENGEINVGLHGINDPLIQFTDPDFTTNEVDGIELYSQSKTHTEWKFYEPCTF